MWLEYKDANVRELFIFYFENQEKKFINRFTKGHGMISHVKFLKSEDRRSDKYIFYVKDTNQVVRMDISKQCSQQLIGETGDSILATYVTHNRIR